MNDSQGSSPIGDRNVRTYGNIQKLGLKKETLTYIRVQTHRNTVGVWPHQAPGVSVEHVLSVCLNILRLLPCLSYSHMSVMGMRIMTGVVSRIFEFVFGRRVFALRRLRRVYRRWVDDGLGGMHGRRACTIIDVSRCRHQWFIDYS